MVFKQNQRAETQYLNTVHYSLGKENGPQQMAHRIPIQNKCHKYFAFRKHKTVG